MTNRALQADRLERSRRIEETGNPDDGVQLQQRKRHGRIVEIDLPLQQLLAQIRG